MPNIGDVIGKHYRLQKRVGGGGFSTSYIAEDIENEQQYHLVFIKHLKPRYLARQRFNTEAATLKKLGNHPQIPGLLNYFEEDNQFFLVQEFIRGKQFKEEIVRQILSEAELIAFLRDLLKILNFVHKHKVIHRDINPTNIIRQQEDNQLFLIDFGAVKEMSTTSLDPETKIVYTQVVGTPGYMPPEQYNGKPKYSSDLYALGRTAIYALTGKEPLELEDKTTGELKNWQEYTYVSPSLAAILNKMIHPKYSQRYLSAAEVLQELEPLFQVGKIIGKNYHIISYLTEKRGQRLYLANNIRPSPPSPCLLKQFIPDESSYATPEVKQRFARQRFATELNFLQRLSDHPQIPQLWEHFEQGGQLYLAEEFIDGMTLSEELQANNRFSEQQVIEFLEDVLTILDFIHQQGFIHQDIQPSNLLRRKQDNQIMLIDFSVVKEIYQSTEGQDNTSYLRRLSAVEGYMAPEQMSGRATFSSDLYSLGLIALEALTGISPHQLSSPKQTGEIDYASGLQVSSTLAKILDKMIATDLQQRYQSASEVLIALKRAKKKPRHEFFRLIKPWYWYLFLILIIIALIIFIF
jgi:serine/threonine protein kinase